MSESQSRNFSLTSVAGCVVGGAVLAAAGFAGLVWMQSEALNDAALDPAEFGGLTVRIEPETSGFPFDLKRPVIVTLRHKGDLLAAWQGAVHFGLKPSATLHGLPAQGGLLQNVPLLLNPAALADETLEERSRPALMRDVLTLRFSLTGGVEYAHYEVPGQSFETGSGTCRSGLFESSFEAGVEASTGESVLWRATFEGGRCEMDGMVFETGPQYAELSMEPKVPYRFSIRSESDGWTNPFASSGKSSLSWTSGLRNGRVTQTVEARSESVEFAKIPAIPEEFSKPLSGALSVEVSNAAVGALPTIADALAVMNEPETVNATAERMSMLLEKDGIDVRVRELRLKTGRNGLYAEGSAKFPPLASGKGTASDPSGSFRVELTEHLARTVAPMLGITDPAQFDRVFRTVSPKKDAAPKDGEGEGVFGTEEPLRCADVEFGSDGLSVNGTKMF